MEKPSLEAQRQNEIFEAMQQPDFYPHPVETVEQRETHISKVFLTGAHAYKVKKAVNLGFLDFTTLEKRRYFCRQEVTLNRRLSHNVYLDVLPITLEHGRYRLAGPGTCVEYAVRMNQLPEGRSMIRLLQAGNLDEASLEALAELLAGFYAGAGTGGRINEVGSWETVRANCEENFSQTEEFAGSILEERVYLIVRSATRAFLRRRRDLFERRIEKGMIRDCHGDLRAGHVYFTDTVQVIDCIEFNERFRYGDIASDLAFLAMDLDYEGFADIARGLLETYVRRTMDLDLFVLLDFYKCYRAFVRAKVNCLRLQDVSINKQEADLLLARADEYMKLSYRYAVQFSRPTIMVVCGMPGSGKSTIAGELAKALGIKVFASDIIRKELFHIPPSEEVDVPFEQGIYSQGATSLTYGRLLLQAQEELERGGSIILDATYGSRHERSEVVRLARDVDVNIIFVECRCNEEMLKSRLLKRKGTSSVSDARIHHFEHLKARFEPLDDIPDEMHISVDTSGPLEEGMRSVLCRDYDLLSIQTAEAMTRSVFEAPRSPDESGLRGIFDRKEI